MALRRSIPLIVAAISPLFGAGVASAQPAPNPTPAAPQSPEPARGSLMPDAPDGTPGAPASGAAGAAAQIDPAQDAQKLAAQGKDKDKTLGPPSGSDGTIGASPREVYSEEWWAHTRPIVELHGYFRTRGELYHNFTLGRHNYPGADDQNLWPQPLDHSFTGVPNLKQYSVRLCGDSGKDECTDKSQASANMRLRLNPELHVSDNLRILSTVDALDNMVLGSTPDAYAMQPRVSKTGYGPALNGYNGYAPFGVFSTSQGAPTAGVNGYRNSIEVKRVWAEYLSPIGLLRFGRMPLHWGLGILANSGDGLDDDWMTNSDRIMFVSGVKSWDLYFGGSWDFVSTGPTSASPYDIYGGQPYNTANLTNADQWSAFVARRMNPELQKLALARGEVVVNGGLFAIYRKQLLDVKGGENPVSFDFEGERGADSNNGLIRRGAKAFIPDAWIQVRWKKLRVEAELAHIRGSLENTGQVNDVGNPVDIRMWGLATQTEYRAVEDKLKLQFGFGWASGDPNVEGLNPGANGLQPALNDGRGPISTFRFHPAYMVDQIFFRKILTRVEGAYYFRPSVDYDFIRNANGQKFGGGAAAIWSRASEFVQTPGNKRDLGVELDLSLYYQAKDGSLNDDPTKLGGFYAMLQYGVFFPLGGLEYLPKVQETALQRSNLGDIDVSAAQTVRLFLGVAF